MVSMVAVAAVVVEMKLVIKYLPVIIIIIENCSEVCLYGKLGLLSISDCRRSSMKHLCLPPGWQRSGTPGVLYHGAPQVSLAGDHPH
jgi:hypothetical protein